jgi:hypothetical protein
MLKRKWASINFPCKFWNKHGVFLESLKCYKTKIYSIFEKLQNGKDGVNDIKVFFYDSVRMPSELGDHKLLTDQHLQWIYRYWGSNYQRANEFMNNLKAIFITKLRADNSKDETKHWEASELFIISKTRFSCSIKIKQYERNRRLYWINFQKHIRFFLSQTKRLLRCILIK